MALLSFGLPLSVGAFVLSRFNVCMALLSFTAYFWRKRCQKSYHMGSKMLEAVLGVLACLLACLLESRWHCLVEVQEKVSEKLPYRGGAGLRAESVQA